MLLFPSSSYWLDRVLPFCLCNGVFPIRICSFSFVRRTFHMYVYFDPRVFQFFLYCFYHTLPVLLSFLTMPSWHSNLTFRSFIKIPSQLHLSFHYISKILINKSIVVYVLLLYLRFFSLFFLFVSDDILIFIQLYFLSRIPPGSLSPLIYFKWLFYTGFFNFQCLALRQNLPHLSAIGNGNSIILGFNRHWFQTTLYSP